MKEITVMKTEMTWEEAQAAAVKEGGRLPKYEETKDLLEYCGIIEGERFWVDEPNVFVQKGFRYVSEKNERYTTLIMYDEVGIKHDSGKLRWDLMPIDIWEHIIWLNITFIQAKLTDYEKIKLAKEQDWCLLAAGLLREIIDFDSVVKVITEGAKKYGENNWQLVDKAEQRFFSALMRHLDKGSSLNSDDFNLSHTAHAVVNCIFLQWFENKRRIRR